MMNDINKDEFILKFENKVYETICTNDMLNGFHSVVAGVSGGADSMAMLFVINKYCRDNGIKLVAAHVNHMLRGNESDGDEEYLRSFCENNRIELKVLRKDIHSYSKELSTGLENAGRIARYAFFKELSENEELCAIAVAHNRDDRAETIFMNIARGSGIEGLRGIPYKRENIVRPLLDIDKNDINKYCEFVGIKPRFDSSNAENTYMRNRVRNRIFPFINDVMGVNIADKLISLGDLAEEDSSFICEIADNFIKTNALIEESKISYKINDLLKLRYSVISRVLQYTAGMLTNRNTDVNTNVLDKENAEKAIDFIRNFQTGKYLCLSNNIKAEIKYGMLIVYNGSLCKNNIQNVNNEEHILNLDSILDKPIDVELESVDAGIRFEIEKYNGQYSKQNSKVQYFDYNKAKCLSKELRVRFRKEGDFIQPVNMKGSVSLKKFFINNKIPKEERNYIPLLEASGEVVWICGYRSSEKVKTEPTTEYVLKVQILKDY